MFNQLVLLTVVCLSLVFAVPAGKATATRTPKVACGYGDMEKCCPKMPAIFTADSVTKCMPKPTSGLRHVGKCSVHEIAETKAFNCAMECLFKENGYILANGKVDLVTLNAKLKELETSSPDWATAIQATTKKCTGKLPKPTRKPCVSGSSTVAKCILRNFMTLCPTPQKTDVCKGFFTK